MIHLRVATSLSDQDRLFIANWRPLPLQVSEQRPVFLSWLRTFQKSLANNGACEAWGGGPTAHWRKLQGKLKLRCSHEKCLIFKTKMQSSLWTQITNQQTVYQQEYPLGTPGQCEFAFPFSTNVCVVDLCLFPRESWLTSDIIWMWPLPVIPALGRQSRENWHKPMVSLGYRVNSRSVKVTCWDPVQKH